MPVSRFVLIFTSALLAAALSIWLGFLIARWADLTSVSGAVFPVALMVGYLAWRKFGAR